MSKTTAFFVTTGVVAVALFAYCVKKKNGFHPNQQKKSTNHQDQASEQICQNNVIMYKKLKKNSLTFSLRMIKTIYCIFTIRNFPELQYGKKMEIVHDLGADEGADGPGEDDDYREDHPAEDGQADLGEEDADLAAPRRMRRPHPVRVPRPVGLTEYVATLLYLIQMRLLSPKEQRQYKAWHHKLDPKERPFNGLNTAGSLVNHSRGYASFDGYTYTIQTSPTPAAPLQWHHFTTGEVNAARHHRIHKWRILDDTRRGLIHFTASIKCERCVVNAAAQWTERAFSWLNLIGKKRPALKLRGP